MENAAPMVSYNGFEPVSDSLGMIANTPERKPKRKLSSQSQDECHGKLPSDEIFSQTGIKRRRDDDNALANDPEAKNATLYGLTLPIWRHTFTYLPPASLARLIQVSKAFHKLLYCPTSGTSQIFSPAFNLQQLEQEQVWLKCHQRFAPGLPKALEYQTELSMWNLIKGTRCFHCGEKRSLQTLSNSESLWQAGPRPDCVRVIWSFRIRACRLCFLAQIRREKDLILDSTFPSVLIEGLPFVFLLDSGNPISESLFKEITIPDEVKATKVFYNPQIELIKQCYNGLRNGDTESLKNWIDSLPSRRFEIEQDASRWEQWERKGILSRLNAKATGLKKDKKAKPSQVKLSARSSTVGPRASDSSDHSISPKLTNVRGELGTNEGYSTNLLEAGRELRNQGTKIHVASNGSGGQSRSTRAARRLAIEQRCLTLETPIFPQLLEHMTSFQSAIKIDKDLDDQQWGILKQRLLDEQAEVQTLSGSSEPNGTRADGSMSLLQFQTKHDSNGCEPDLQPDPLNLTITNSSIENQSQVKADATQTLLGQAADEIIRNKWNGGASLSKDSCFQFAADILILSREAIYKYIRSLALRLSGPITPLNLEHMKWLFETRVKPFTEKYCKEIFICHGCENGAKTYGFEAVVQHYAAKHTNSLSLGNVIVHWKAEWPEVPPFHPKPMLLRALVITSANNPSSQSNIRLARSEHMLEGGSHKSNTAQLELSSDPLIQQGFVDARARDLPERQILRSEHPQFNHLVSDRHPSSQSSKRTSVIQPAIGLDDHAFTRGSLQGLGSTVHTEAGSPDCGVPTTETFRAHQAEMAKLARDVWFATAGVKGMPGPVRIQLIIHHACENFVNRFGLEPGVNMFLFAINHESAMRPLRSLYGFSCHACTFNLPGAISLMERKQSSTLPHLLNHFMSSHAEYHGLDWRKDMIQLPPLNKISELAHAPGMDDYKLSLLASAFPGAFSFPQNPASALLHTASAYDTHLSDDYHDHSRVVDTGFQAGDPNRSSGYSGIIQPKHTSPHINLKGEDEYDPCRPTYIGRIVESHTNSATSSSDKVTNYLYNNSLHGPPAVDAAIQRHIYSTDPPQETYRSSTNLDSKSSFYDQRRYRNLFSSPNEPLTQHNAREGYEAHFVYNSNLDHSPRESEIPQNSTNKTWVHQPTHFNIDANAVRYGVSHDRHHATVYVRNSEEDDMVRQGDYRQTPLYVPHISEQTLGSKEQALRPAMSLATDFSRLPMGSKTSSRSIQLNYANNRKVARQPENRIGFPEQSAYLRSEFDKFT